MVSQGFKRIIRSMFEGSSAKNEKGVFPSYPALLSYGFMSRIFCGFF